VVTLTPVEGGTLLTLAHSDVPDGQTSYEQGGWQSHYFEPMKKYFAAFSGTPGPSAKASGQPGSVEYRPLPSPLG
jgi:hypothetical protein